MMKIVNLGNQNNKPLTNNEPTVAGFFGSDGVLLITGGSFIPSSLYTAWEVGYLMGKDISLLSIESFKEYAPTGIVAAVCAGVIGYNVVYRAWNWMSGPSDKEQQPFNSSPNSQGEQQRLLTNTKSQPTYQESNSTVFLTHDSRMTTPQPSAEQILKTGHQQLHNLNGLNEEQIKELQTQTKSTQNNIEGGGNSNNNIPSELEHTLNEPNLPPTTTPPVFDPNANDKQEDEST